MTTWSAGAKIDPHHQANVIKFSLTPFPLQIAHQMGKIDILSPEMIRSQVENKAKSESLLVDFGETETRGPRSMRKSSSLIGLNKYSFTINIRSSKMIQSPVENEAMSESLLVDFGETETQRPRSMGRSSSLIGLHKYSSTEENQDNLPINSLQLSTQDSMQVNSLHAIPELQPQDIKFSIASDDWIIECEDTIDIRSSKMIQSQVENEAKSESLLVDFGETETQRPRSMGRSSSLIGLHKYSSTEENQDNLPINSLQLSTQDSMQVNSLHAIPELQDTKSSPSGDEWSIEGEDIEANNYGPNSEIAARRNSMPMSSAETKNTFAKGAARRESESLLVDFGKTETRRQRMPRRMSWCNLIGLNAEKNQEDLPICSAFNPEEYAASHLFE